MLSNKPNVIIFGAPRSGTKLLANIMEQQGYHNFGEFFEVVNSEIIYEDLPKATRLSREIQFRNFSSKKIYPSMTEDLYNRALLTKDRINIFQRYKHITPTTVTIFGFTVIHLYPELLTLFDNRVFLCIRRKNILDQLLSGMITLHFKNWDDEYKSRNLLLDLNDFSNRYFDIKKIERIQNHLIEEDRGRLIDFDKLITGTEDLGFGYNVTTTDQHIDLENLIINIDEVRERFNYLESIY